MRISDWSSDVCSSDLIPIIAGLVVSAVADEMLLAHPQGHIAPAMLAVSVGGPLLFLIGNMAFKKATTDRPLPPFSHMLGSVGLLGAGAWAWLGHWQPQIGRASCRERGGQTGRSLVSPDH